jgi:hypothetical protein
LLRRVDFGIGGIFLIPSSVFLYAVFKSDQPSAAEVEEGATRAE